MECERCCERSTKARANAFEPRTTSASERRSVQKRTDSHTGAEPGKAPRGAGQPKSPRSWLRSPSRHRGRDRKSPRRDHWQRVFPHSCVTLGQNLQASRMSAEIPVASGLASVTFDRGLYVVTATVTTIAGILAALPLVGLSRALRLYASLFAFALIAFLMLTLFAVRKRWPVLSWSVRSIARIPSLKSWIEKRYLMVQSVENALFDFHHKTPQAFWGSFSLNLAAQCMAVSEVCLILWLMGVKIGFFSALVIEALTKLVNVLGNFNPGNIGTYEGGTMLIGKMFGLSSATGLALGLSRRLRSFFWAAV